MKYLLGIKVVFIITLITHINLKSIQKYICFTNSIIQEVWYGDGYGTLLIY